MRGQCFRLTPIDTESAGGFTFFTVKELESMQMRSFAKRKIRFSFLKKYFYTEKRLNIFQSLKGKFQRALKRKK